MKPDWVSDDLLSQMESIHSRLRPIFLGSVVPIYAYFGDKMILFGSGTLLRVADSRLLVTASHVTCCANKKGIGLFVPADSGKKKFVSVRGRMASVSKSTVDISFVELPEDCFSVLNLRKFLNLSDFEVRPGSSRKALYYIHGYPSCWASDDGMSSEAELVAFSYGTVLYEGPTENLDDQDYNPQANILLQVCKSLNCPMEGTHGGVPEELGGVSGCSIWRVAELDSGRAKWNAIQPKVVAVETGVFRGKVLGPLGENLEAWAVKGVWWGVLTPALWDGFPELRPSLRLHSDLGPMC